MGRQVAASEARANGFTVLESTFEDAPIASSSIDVLLLDSIIERVQSPRTVLAKAYEVLRPGGTIVVFTPKFGGPAYLIHGPGWNGFRHGYHTFLFTGKTLGRYLRKAGFDVLRRPRRDRPLDDKLVLWGRKAR